MSDTYKIPLLMTPQPEGGYTVTSPVLPELVTEGETLEEALGHVQDAARAALELYEDLGRPLPANLRQTVKRLSPQMDQPGHSPGDDPS